ncbi:hypothetical protein AB8616_06440 [Marinomonas sp. RS-M-Aa-14]|uniref:hypothetical protein n=1 Tax=Marinomonas sp. RS-M-Aa-14 TaxID=3241169 RepID=UPI003AAB2030
MLANIIGTMVRFEFIQPSLQSRVFSTGNDNFADFNLIGLVQLGGAIVTMEETHHIAEMSIFCIPHKKLAKVSVPAGTQIWLLGYRNEPQFTGYWLRFGQCETSNIDAAIHHYTLFKNRHP